MPKTKLQIIKPYLAVNELPDGDVLHRLTSTHDGVFNHPTLFPNTPFDGPTFKAVINHLATAAAAAVQDGGKAAVEERNKAAVPPENRPVPPESFHVPRYTTSRTL